MQADIRDDVPARRLVTVEEAARMLSVSRARFYLLMDAGKISYLKAGRSRRVSIEAIDAFIKAHTIPARTDPAALAVA